MNRLARKGSVRASDDVDELILALEVDKVKREER